MELERWVEIANKYGLHARVATELVKVAQAYDSNITLTREGTEDSVDGKSILGLMSMGAETGARLLLRVAGADAEQAMEAVVEMFQRTFDE